MTSPTWKDAYAEIRPTYEVYEKKLRELVTTILDHAKIDVVQVEGRVKTVESFNEKIGRKSGKYADPLKDMTDLVGLRVIAYYVEDVNKIVELLRKQFTVLEEHSANKQDALAPDQFGYTSNHLVIRMGDNRRDLPEWSQHADLAVEIQVRTTLQHAWAAVHHKLSYKRVEEVPISLQRRLFRLSALFEMADEQFSAIKNSASELSDEYSAKVKHGNLGIRVDADSIDAYILNSAKTKRMVSIGEDEFGFTISLKRERQVKQYRSKLISAAKKLGAETIDEFDKLLTDDDEVTRKAIRALWPSGDTSDHPLHGFILFILLLLHNVEEEFALNLFTTSISEALFAAKKRLGSQP